MIVGFFLCMLAWQSDPDWMLYEKALKARDQLNFQEVIRLLEAAIEQDPESKAQNRTHGVQFEPYYPYHLLAEAHLWLKDAGKTEEYLRKAYEYGENNDPDAQKSIARTERFLPDLRNTRPATIVADTAPVWEAFAYGDLEGALDTLKQLQDQHPQQSDLAGMRLVLETLISNKSRLADAIAGMDELRADERQEIESLLREARSLEQAGQLNEAFTRYLAASVIDGENAEAANGLSRVRTTLEAEGRDRAELESQVENARLARDSELNAEMTRLNSEADDMRLTNSRLIEELDRFRKLASAPPPADVDFDFILSPSQEGRFTADIQILLNGNTPLQDVQLFVNNETVVTWPVQNNSQSFRGPLLKDYDFGMADNQLLVQVRDTTGRVFPKTHRYKFPLPPPSWTPRVISFTVYALLAGLTWYFLMRIRKRRQAFRNRFNPYIAGAPILNHHMFYGRKPLLKQILNTLHNNSLMIYGERRIGKTSFLHQLHAILPEMEDPHYDFTPVFLDLQGVTEDQFFAFMDQEILETLASQGIELERPKRHVDARLFTNRLRQAVNLLKKRTEKSPKLVLLLDEVDIMNGFSEHTNQQLRSVFMKGFARHLVAVMAGIHINKQWKSEGSPWYNFFEQIQLKPFSDNQATQLITEPVRGVYQYNQEAVERIIDITGGKPYLIQKLCVNLIAHILKQNRRKITLRDVDSVFQEIKSEVFSA